MTSSPDETQAIEHVVARLIERFPDASAERVHAIVGEEHHLLDGRPVRDFVPVLVERSARRRLAVEWTEVAVAPEERDIPRRADDPPEVDPMERERQRQLQRGAHLFGDPGGGPA